MLFVALAALVAAAPPLAPGAYQALRSELAKSHNAVDLDVARVTKTLRDGGCVGARFVIDTHVRQVQSGNEGRLYVPVRAHGKLASGEGCFVTGFVEVRTPVITLVAESAPTMPPAPAAPLVPAPTLLSQR